MATSIAPAAQTEPAAGGAASTEQATATEGTTTTTEATQAEQAATTTAATEQQASPVVPEKYDLKPPEGSPLDAAAIERTAATARELGLSQESAQKVTELLSTEVATRVEAERAALLTAYAPGGSEWQKQTDAWKAEALADATLGKTEAERTAAIQRGQGVLAKYTEANPADADGFKSFLNDSGLGNHPAVVRFFSWLGKAAGEGQMVTPGAAGGGGDTEADKLARMYPSMQKQ